jgi:hypothetical protein
MQTAGNMKIAGRNGFHFRTFTGNSLQKPGQENIGVSAFTGTTGNSQNSHEISFSS